MPKHKNKTGEPVEQPLVMQVFSDASGEWRWRLVSANNRIIASSGESFTRGRDAQRAAENLITDVLDTYGSRTDFGIKVAPSKPKL